MIAIPQPSIALISSEALDAPYRMWARYVADISRSPADILSSVATLISGTSAGRIKVLVIACHGRAINGQMGYGLALGTGINNTNTSCFNILRGKVDVIITVACGAAHIASGHVPGGFGDGHALMSSIARISGAKVIASTELQVGSRYLPANYIDNMEGLVTVYNEHGHLVNQIRNPSTYINAATQLHSQN